MKKDFVRREKVIYSATTTRDSRSDLQSHLWVKVRKFLEGAHWATKRQIQIGVGRVPASRDTPIERLLKSRSDWGDLRAVPLKRRGKQLAYAKPLKTKNFDPTNLQGLHHGIQCTECLIRFSLAKAGLILPESYFRRFGVQPEWAMLHERTALLPEFSTDIDTIDRNRIPGKVAAYQRNLYKIEEDLNRKAIVVFILEVPRDVVEWKVKKYQPDGPFLFTDYSTFLATSPDELLTKKIWIWKDGSENSLIR